MNSVSLPNYSAAQEARWLGLSALIHVVVFVVLILISGTFSKTGGIFSEKVQPIEEKKPTEVLDLGSTLEEEHLFDGISYTAYKANKLRVAHAKSQASSILAKLKGLKLPPGAASGGLSANEAHVGGAALVDPNAVGTDASLLDSLRKQPFTFQATLPADAAGRAISDKERAELRQKFKALQQEFRRAYTKGLQIDPHLQATIGFEAQVQKNGYLKVIRFRTRGTFRDESISLMKSEMDRLISQLLVSPELAGTVIRGESVFAR